MIKLNEREYFKDIVKKKQIVLHHTVSNSNAESVIRYWNLTAPRIATPFVIELNGNIVELFDPKYWSWHIGKGANKKDNQESIGIEVINAGGLVKRNNKIYWWDGTHEFKGEYLELEKEWRGFKYFAKYTEPQEIALGKLVTSLCLEFNIRPVILPTLEYKREFFEFDGIVNHSNLRADKTDLSPAFDLKKLQERIYTI